jgi:SAM-dependent methyltransferase
MASYDPFACHYDTVTGDSSAETAFVDGLIKQANRKAVTLLEVACGTGSIIAPLAGKYQVSGLDMAPGMLAVARHKLPEGTPLYEEDMARFSLNKKFDAIICIYHGINHLLDFSAWERFFDCIHAHLNEGGVFVFDICTIGNLRMMTGMPKEVEKFGDNYLLTWVRTDDEVIFDWHIEVFELQRSGRYSLLTEVIRTVSFPLGQIRDALHERFTDVRIIDSVGNAVTEDTENRTWFVCTKCQI